MRGEMLFFNDSKSFGFIRTEEGERLYVHRDGFLPGKPPEGRCAGKKVMFEREPLQGVLMFEQEAIEGEHSHKAVAVTLLEEALGGRARLRRAGGIR